MTDLDFAIALIAGVAGFFIGAVFMSTYKFIGERSEYRRGRKDGAREEKLRHEPREEMQPRARLICLQTQYSRVRGVR
jgi:hypothetical protein